MPLRNEVDAVTVDAFGTIVELRDPVEALTRALAARGVARNRATIERGFAAEAEYYVRHSLRGRDEGSLKALRRDCAEVFLQEVGAHLDPGEFAPDYVAALEFHVIDGAAEALDSLRAARLRLACVGNWDCSLASVLERLGLAGRFDTIVSSAVVGVEKPDARIFRLALEQLGVAHERALHIGDRDTDREGARAAGLRFEPVPLATLPARLGL